MTTTDTNEVSPTPRTDACPHCGADEIIYFPYEGVCRLGHQKWKCKTPFVRLESGQIAEVTFRTDLCREREKSQKLETEVKMLKKSANRYKRLAIYWERELEKILGLV